MSHNKTGVYLTVNKLQPPTLGLLLSLTLLIDVTEYKVYHIIYLLCVDVDSKYLNKLMII
jgi:hypothetical protein